MERFRVSSLERCWPDLQVLFEAHRPLVDAILAGDALAAEDAARIIPSRPVEKVLRDVFPA